ncbi:uncharacterized protein LOC114283878 [Camellia sinensis]|uniref:uncharacterized protein LOC114283878 n=1 Tax=Camellia sinensis TaxID=4442 RepID=UPI001035BA99|nr:uncharacterized protein LOC114283878 [Camellia sinensis]
MLFFNSLSDCQRPTPSRRPNPEPPIILFVFSLPLSLSLHHHILHQQWQPQTPLNIDDDRMEQLQNEESKGRIWYISNKSANQKNLVYCSTGLTTANDGVRSMLTIDIFRAIREST